jgi:hypothetical protein
LIPKNLEEAEKINSNYPKGKQKKCCNGFTFILPRNKIITGYLYQQ